jgi:hypothetical protein
MEHRERERQQDRARRTERAPNGARVTFGEPVDTRLAIIHDALDQLTKLHQPTFSARMALLSIAGELGERVDNGVPRAD